MLKKIFTLILTGAMIMSAIPFSVHAEGKQENVVYVSLDGREDAAGTFADPFNSIEKARDYLRGNATKDVRGVVYIREGVYHINKSIELTDEDSFVTYMAFGDEEVEISGVASLNKHNFKKLDAVTGDKFSSKSRIKEEIRDKVYVYDLGKENIPVGDIYKNGFNWTKKPLRPELAQNGELLTLAQYPDDGTFLGTGNLGIVNKGDEPRQFFFDKTDNVKTYEQMLNMNAPVFSVNSLPASAKTWAGEYPSDNALCDNTKYETDGWLFGYYANHYANDNVKMNYGRTVNGKFNIYCKYPSVYSVNNSLKVEAINLLCEMDKEGEYYIDRFRGNNVLYLYPENGNLENITLSSMDVPLVTINNAEGIVISGISFTGTTNHGITLNDCESCVIDNCELYNISMDAVRIGNDNGMITCDPEYTTYGGGHNNTVKNCLIHDMGHGGVYVAGGERKSLERGNNKVSHCEFYNFSRLATYTPAVYLEGVGNTAEDNYIHDAPHMVIQLMGNDMLVTRNKIVNTCYNANDMAPIYTGRDWSWLGNVISYNYIEDVRYSDATNFNFGIYMDDNASGVIIKNNVFNNIGGNGVYLNKGYGSYVADNIFLDSTGQYYRYLTGGNEGWKRPLPNEKALKYRFYDMLRTEEEAIASGDEGKTATKGYWNSDENIACWIEHYNEIYNELDGKGDFDLSKMYFPKEGDASQAVWLDENAVINQNHNTVMRNITVNTADLWLKGGLYNNVNVSDKGSFDIMRHRASSVKALGINLETGKISDSSTLMSDANYGADWIDEWNTNYDISKAGMLKTVDKEKLFVKIKEAEKLPLKSEEMTAALGLAHKAASDTECTQKAVDDAYTALLEELSKVSEQYELNMYNVTVTLDEMVKLAVTGENAEDTLWYTSDTSVAVVDRNGNVYPVSEGECKITALVEGYEFVCRVKVSGTSEDKEITVDTSTVKVTSQESNNKGVSAVDGNANTRWAAAHVDYNPYPQSIEFDLGKEYDIGQIDISFYYSGTAKDKDRAYEYAIYTKGEEGDWSMLIDQRNNTDKTSSVSLFADEENASRYVKIEAYKCDKGGLAALSIYEIDLWKRGAEVSYEKLYADELNAAKSIDWEVSDSVLKGSVEKAIAEAENAADKKTAYEILREAMIKVEGRVEYIASDNDFVSCYVPEGATGQLIVAVYSSDVMTNVKTYPVRTKAGEVFSDKLPEIASGTKVKIMLWDDFDNLEPIMEYVTE